MELRTQSWGDDLRLPTIISAAHTEPLFEHAEGLRKPPVPFQSKHLPALKRNTWYALQRPSCRSRTGLVYVWPEAKSCLYISGDRQRPRIALLRIRLDPQFLAPGMGATVFQATLSAAGRRLWVEDVLIWKGRDVWSNEPFSARWALATQWLTHSCVADSRLIGGISVELAPWTCLDAVRPAGIWEFQSDQAGQRRLYWIAAPGNKLSEEPVKQMAPVPIISETYTGPLVAIATRDAGPDQWNLTSADGVKLGRGLIRKMTISTELRAFPEKTVLVEVEWVATFSKWEIKGLHTEGPATHSRFFEPPK